MLKIEAKTTAAVAVKNKKEETVWIPKAFCELDKEEEFVIATTSRIAEEKGIDIPRNECLGMSVKIKKEGEEKTVDIVVNTKYPKKSTRKAQVKKKYKKVMFAYKNLLFVVDDVEGVEFTSKNGLVCIGSYKKGEKVNLDEVFEKYVSEKKEKIVETIKKEIKENSWKGKVQHKEYETIKTCVQENIPVYLYGPAGSGKNHTLMEVAKDLGLEFYFTNSVQQEYKLTGFIDAGGTFHETEFYKAFVNGGLFFLDEMDASIPEVLVLLNAAIANGYFEFPNGKVYANENFRVVAAGNTIGSGADEMYTGRLVLDQATLDRFVSIEFGYDYNVEMSLAKGNKELVSFVEMLRKRAYTTCVRATFSYRCIISVVKLEGKMDLAKILRIAVFKGMDIDTINTLKNGSVDNKYFKEMEKIVA